ncbi:MAG: hypothetical protein ACR2OC_09480 [Solirubrobacterales bacterium]
MKRLISTTCAVLIAGGAFSSTALGANDANPNNVAAKQCQAEKQAVGNKAFKEIYGGKNAMQRCHQANRSEAEAAVANASQQCAAEREAIGEEAFIAQYGKNENDKNAFGKCVSAKAQAETDENVAATANASQQCRAERKASGDEAFAAKYGTNANGRNAFGKCVSALAQAEPAPTA